MRFVAFSLLFALSGCSPDGSGPSRPGDGADGGVDTSSPTGEFGALCSDGIDNDSDGLIDCDDPGCTPAPACGGLPDAGTGECTSVSRSAESAIAPVDIVWVIDSSGSMSNEAEIIQTNMNSFVSSISAAGLDIRVVVITAPGFVTVPPPLGTDMESFLKIDQAVGSSQGMEILVSQIPTYLPFLRRDSQLHIIAVTDDESRLDATSFRAMMTEGLLRTFRFHAIASPPGSGGGGFIDRGCSGPHGDAAANGEQYWAASSATGGLQLSICTPDWSTLFAELTRAIAVPMALPCVYEIPEPPDGAELDRTRVNVEYTRGSGGTETLPNVGTYDRCTGEGWYYDGDRIAVCPNTCRRLEADAAGRVDIAFGCETLLI